MSFKSPKFETKPESEKETKIEKIEAEVNEIADATGRPIDEGIKNAVVSLRLWEFPTRQSCEGHSEDDPEEESESRTPWIDVEVPEPKGWKDNEKIQEEWKKENLKQQVKMIKSLDAFYKDRNVPFDKKLHLKPMGIYGAFTLENQGAEIIETLPKEEQDKKRETYQQEMNDFANFLKDKFLKE